MNKNFSSLVINILNQAIVYLGLCFIIAIWAVISWQTTAEYNAISSKVETDTTNIARLFEESVARSMGEVDQAIQYVRQTYVRGEKRAQWPEILNEGYKVGNQALQLSVIDAKGFLIANNLSRSVPNPIYLGDREHFLAHANVETDFLFISKPVIIHSSGTRSVQLTRGFKEPDGAFGGVIVASFDPAYFARLYSGLNLGRNSGLALIGADGVIRAGAGLYSDQLGKNIKRGDLFKTFEKTPIGVAFEATEDRAARRITSFRPLSGYPHIVMVTAEDRDFINAWAHNKIRYIIAGGIISALVLLAVIRIAQTRIRLQNTGQTLALTARELELTLSHMTQGILMVDGDGMVAVINERCRKLLDLPAGLGSQKISYTDIIRQLSEAGEYNQDGAQVASAALKYIWDSCQNPPLAVFERTRPNGVILEVCTEALAEGGFVRTLTDVTERRRHEAQITHIARHDQLTALGNRVLLHDELEKVLSTENQEEFSLHLIDLDGFKPVNDTFGHPVGDKLLKLVAERLRCNLRQNDTVARLGGDEFAIVEVNRENNANLGAMSQRLCQVLAEPYVVDGHKLEISASIGIAIYPRDGKSPTDLFKAADLALYSAKAEGRATYRFYNEEMQTFAIKRRNLKEGLKRAIAEKQFELHYQPISSATTLQPSGYEALIRWRDPERGLIPPLDFIPLAEETGLIIPIGEWAIHQACHDIARLSQTLRIAVNLSPVQFRDPAIVATMQKALQQTGLAAHRLEIEITESTIMHNDAVTLKRLEELRDLGISLSIDDFGTGYSSLSYLQQYPIDRIKIDRSFVSCLPESKNSIAIIKAITALAAALGMETIAEGVETQEQLHQLQMLGCHEVQGYYISKPRRFQDIYADQNAVKVQEVA